MLRNLMILLIGMLLITSCGTAEDLPLSTSTSEQLLRQAPPSIAPTPLSTVTSEQLLRKPPPFIACYSPPANMEPPYPMPDQIQAAPALVDLGSATFPNDANLLRGVLAKLPNTIAGHERTNFVENEHSFGVRYTEIGRPADEHPSFLQLFVSRVPRHTTHYPWDIFHPSVHDTIQLDQDVFWMEKQGQESIVEDYNLSCYPSISLSWLPPKSDFAFGAAASRREDLEAITSAFITTAASSPGPVSKLPVTPTPIPTPFP
ncbi:MAG TPA: hypothetical protein VGD69_24920 [Herpetosiphonaceae bacterium]